MEDFGLKKLEKSLRRLRFPAANPITLKYLENTKDLPNIYKATEKSPKFGFLKIKDLLETNPIDRVKYLNVKEHMTEKTTLKDQYYRIISLPQILGIGAGVISQFKHLVEKNAAVDDSKISSLDQGQIWQELQAYAQKKWGILQIGFTKVPQDIIIKNRHIFYWSVF